MAKMCLRRSFPCGGRDASGSFQVARVRDDRQKGGKPPTGFRFAVSPARRATPELDRRPLVLVRASVLPRQKLPVGRKLLEDRLNAFARKVLSGVLGK
jgi:hypothetical protein